MPYMGVFNQNLVQRMRKLFGFFYTYTGNFEAQPVIVLNDRTSREANICRSADLSDATSATVYTTENNLKKQFYVSSAMISVGQGILNGGTKWTLDVVQEGVARSILIIRRSVIGGGSADINAANAMLSFPSPIPVDRNTAIVITADSATASIRMSGTIQGFYELIN